MALKEFQLVAQSGNKFLHTIRLVDGPWYRFGDVRAATRNFSAVINNFSCAGIGDQLHICVAGGAYRLFHAIRFGDGTWTGFGDVGNAAALQDQIQLQSCASVGRELHVLATSGAKLWHAIRHSNGSWTKFGDVFKNTGAPPGGLISLAAANVADELHICFVDSKQSLRHTIRHADGSWDAIDNLSARLNLPAKPSSVGCAGVNGELHVLFTDFGFAGSVDGLWHAIRHAGENWTACGNVKAAAGDRGGVRALACAEAQGELHLITITANNPDLWHTIRYENGAWSQFGNAEYAITGNVGQMIFSAVGCAGVEQGTYRPPSGSGGGGGGGSPGGCFPGVPGASAVAVNNMTDHDLSVWSLDLMTNAAELVGDLSTGESLTVDLTDCHYSQLIGVDHSWIDEYNATFETAYDPHTWDTATTVEFQKWVSIVLGRSNSAPTSADIY